MKKILFATILALSAGLFYPQNSFINNKNYAEYTLENGMQIFVMEDFSSAPVRIEYSVHAGISSQNAANTGFFPLYTRLFKYAGKTNSLLNDFSSECNADTSRYTITTSPSLVPFVFDELARHAFSPVFSTEDITREYSSLKNEVMQYAQTPAAFINTSIDSRIFAENPWKQDSGIYPQIFARLSPSQIRSILTRIGKFWYTPQNSALFVSGSITKETVLALAEKYFAQYQPAANSGKPEKVLPSGKALKFVMHDSQFSDELTQIVIEYTGLSLNQANLLSATLNMDNSSLKKELCSSSLLNIRGQEYINISAVHKNGCSQTIFQTLLEQNKRSPLEQAESFISTIRQSAENTPENEYDFTKNYLKKTFTAVTEDSASFMNFLSQLWSIDSLADKEDVDSLLLAQKLMNRPEEISSLDTESLKSAFSQENPFIFVLVNSKTYNKYKADFKRLGYEEINSKNGSWYTQKLFKNAASEAQEDKKDEIDTRNTINSNLDIFLSENQNSIKKDFLSNGIPVTVKTNRNTSNISVLISINGGKLAEKNAPGFNTVIINCLAKNIRKEFEKYYLQELFEGFPEVKTETGYSNSSIIIECAKNDLSLCIKSVSDALIFGDITPAEADGEVYSAQTQKRLGDASPVNQMTFRAMKYFYDSPNIRSIFDTEKDILQKTNYTDILSAYPYLLNSSLYSIIIAGNTDIDSVKYLLEENFGVLSTTQKSKKEKLKETVPPPDFPAKTRKINLKIRHLFYTDVKAEDAGPMPAVLIPTKNFADPVQYWFKTPEESKDEAVIFDALLFRLKEKISEKTDVRIFAASNEFRCAALTFTGVEHTNFITETYGKVLVDFMENLATEDSFEVEQIKNAWIKAKLSETQTSTGTVKLLNLSAEAAKNYIEEYKILLKAEAADFHKVLTEYFPFEPLLQIYSSDAKK